MTLERRDDRVAVVRIDNPKVNALSASVLDELAAVFSTLHADPPGAVVVTGGERIFSAGAEVREFEGPEKAAEVTERFHRTLDLVASLPRMTIAAICGYALGGGLELALACDMRIAGRSARLGLPEILLGIIPGGGGTQRLPRLVGPAKAKEMIVTGRQVTAEEAASAGLVNEVVDDAEVLGRALELAGELARGPLVAQALAKRAVDEGLDLGLEEGLHLERELFVDVFGTEDAREGIASFLQSGPGKATFRGR